MTGIVAVVSQRPSTSSFVGKAGKLTTPLLSLFARHRPPSCIATSARQMARPTARPLRRTSALSVSGTKRISATPSGNAAKDVSGDHAVSGRPC